MILGWWNAKVAELVVVVGSVLSTVVNVGLLFLFLFLCFYIKQYYDNAVNGAYLVCESSHLLLSTATSLLPKWGEGLLSPTMYNTLRTLVLQTSECVE
jgi:hypothetical protein